MKFFNNSREFVAKDFELRKHYLNKMSLFLMHETGFF